MKYGVIDLGSNTIRLCIYDITLTDTAPKFKTIVNRKAVVGLAAYVRDGRLTDEGIAVALDTLVKQIKRAKLLKPDRLDIFATAVLRNISNTADVVQYLTKCIEHPIHVLSGYDEAHLGFVGAASDETMHNGLLVDIGGGSTELTRIQEGLDTWNISIGHGCLSMYEAYVSDALPSAEEQCAIAGAFAQSLEGTTHGADINAHTLYGVGGSIRALGKVNAALQPGIKETVLSAESIDYLVQVLEQDRKRFINAVVRVCPERLHTIVCGLCIIEEIFKETGAQVLYICKNGVREGYVLERMLA